MAEGGGVRYINLVQEQDGYFGISIQDLGPYVLKSKNPNTMQKLLCETFEEFVNN